MKTAKKKPKESSDTNIILEIVITKGTNIFCYPKNFKLIDNQLIVVDNWFSKIDRFESVWTRLHEVSSQLNANHLTDYSVSYNHPSATKLTIKSWDRVKEHRVNQSNLDWEWLKTTEQTSLELYRQWRLSIQEEIAKQVKIIGEKLEAIPLVLKSHPPTLRDKLDSFFKSKSFWSKFF